jgi:very-short-patch-repair endonuclease
MIHKQPPATPQAKALRYELMKRGLKCILEPWDKYKHVDILIPDANLVIELNGKHHYLNAGQIKKDISRANYSKKNLDRDTIYIPNLIVDNYLTEVARAVVIVAKERMKKY